MKNEKDGVFVEAEVLLPCEDLDLFFRLSEEIYRDLAALLEESAD